MKRINPNIYPSGGYTFKEQDGSVHSADSWEGVMVRVTAYRKRQRKDFSRVREEVTLQACSKHPILCVEDNGVTPARQKEVSLKGRVLKWLTSMRLRKEKENFKFVNSDMHAARTDVCIRCPLDKSLPHGCGACKAALTELRETLVGGRQTDSRIEACPILGEYLPVSTWIDDPTIVNPSLWQECWRKRTL